MLQLNDTLIAESNPASYVSESFRSLRTYIGQQVLRHTDQGMVLLVASPDKGEGKTTLLANLGVSFSQEGRKVVLIDCDLRQSSLHEVFGMENTNGLSSYLCEGATSTEILRKGGQGLYVVPGGENFYSSPDLLGGQRMVELLEQLKGEYDLILLDSPSALTYADARLLAARTDGVILVAKYAKTARERLRKTKQLMEQAGATLLGIVMNQVK